MNTPFIMTAGPTYIHESVRRIMSEELTNPDIDVMFYEFYKNICEKIKKVMKTENEILILAGEGILGLEAACASLTEENDRVLCIDNGIFGHGFADFVKLYGGNPVFFKSDYDRGINIENLKNFLENDSDFKYATVVHCETPSGITNDVSKICPLLKQYEILTVVDSVSAIGGENLCTDEWKMDIVLGGSQKCISAPVGLTFLSISEEAFKIIYNRKSQIKSFYCNLAAFKDWYNKKWFPYTMPIHLIYAFDKALDRVLLTNYVKKHSKIADTVRKSIVEAGLLLYPKDSLSNTVTALNIPEGIEFEYIYKKMIENYNIMVGSSFDFLKDKVIRIGHMGENCSIDKIFLTLYGLDKIFESANIKLKTNMHKVFSNLI